jgi:hypothetical protein
MPWDRKHEGGLQLALACLLVMLGHCIRFVAESPSDDNSFGVETIRDREERLNVIHDEREMQASSLI